MMTGSVRTKKSGASVKKYGDRQCYNTNIWQYSVLERKIMVAGRVRTKNVVIGSVIHKFLAIDSVRTQHYGDR